MNLARGKKMSKTLEFPIKHIYKNMVFNKNNQVWAFYSLNEEYLRLNSGNDFNRYVERTAEFLSNYEYNYHIMIIPKRFDFGDFTDVMNNEIVKGDFSDIGKTYFDRARITLENEVFLHEYQVIVSVQINKMDSVVTNDISDFMKKFVKRIREDISKVMTFQANVEDDFSYYDDLEKSFRNKTS